MNPHGHGHTPPKRRGRVCVIVNGLPGSGKRALWRAPSRLTSTLPLLSKDAVKDFVASAWPRGPTPEELSALGHDVLWALVRACPDGAVIETWFGPTGRDKIEQELSDAGIGHQLVVQTGHGQVPDHGPLVRRLRELFCPL